MSYKVWNGFRYKVGSPMAAWLKRNRTRLLGQLPKGKRTRLVQWAHWGVAHEPAIHYSEDVKVRAGWLTAKPRNHLPLSTDCSGFVTLCYAMAGLPDPNGLGYAELGYTGTLLSHAASAGQVHTEVAKARPGDLIVYGPGTGAHVVIVVKTGANPLVVSHGSEAGPQLEHALDDPRTPKRVCRYLK